MDIMDKVLESVAITGGASINMTAGTVPDSGYMVSRAGSEVVINGGISRDDLEQFAHFVLQQQALRQCALGQGGLLHVAGYAAVEQKPALRGVAQQV